jgi:citronellol/citronellal dehydrogenase
LGFDCRLLTCFKASKKVLTICWTKQNISAIITGASRGIGRACALALAECGCAIIVAAKTATPDPRLPGTIYSVCEEIVQRGGRALPFQLDVQHDKDCEACVQFALEKFGSVDILINNASALWWKTIEETPMNRFDLMLRVNARGSFVLTKACLPHMKKRGWGFVINMSPPIEPKSLEGRVAYSISKFGMTLVALGVADEGKGKGVAGHSLWPATIVESYAAENFSLGDKAMWRKADILADAVLCIVSQDPNTFTGQSWIDEDLLRDFGLTDFTPYRCDPNVEPPSMKQLAGSEQKDVFQRGKALSPEERAKVAEKFRKEREEKHRQPRQAKM